MYFFHLCGNILKGFYIIDNDLWLNNTKVTYCCFPMPPLSIFSYGSDIYSSTVLRECIVAFSVRQQLSRERGTMLRCTSIVDLV